MGGGGGGFGGGVVFTPTPTPTPSASPTPVPVQVYSETANPGEGVSHLAARALDEYLTQHPSVKLLSEQSFYVIDRLWRGALAAIADPAFVLHPGAVISFSFADIENFIADSRGFSGSSIGSSTPNESPSTSPVISPIVTPQTLESTSPTPGSNGQEANVSGAVGGGDGLLTRIWHWFSNLF